MLRQLGRLEEAIHTRTSLHLNPADMQVQSRLDLALDAQKMIIKISSKTQENPLQAIRISTPGWAGEPVKMEDGAAIQPFHCLPFVEGSTYGLELQYPHATQCNVINDNGTPRFEWEPGGALKGGEFMFFSPIDNAKYYLFNTRLDILPPPGHVIRTEPHARFFTDDAGTVPLPMIGHLQNEWYPRPIFVVFRAPRPGQRHIFRKDEPYAQLLFVPQEMKYEITEMAPEEQAAREAMTKQIQIARDSICTRKWYNSTANEQDNHYKVLAAAFAKGGKAEVERKVREGAERQTTALPHDKSIAECLDMGRSHFKSSHYLDAANLFALILRRDPNNAEAMNYLGICMIVMGNRAGGLLMMAQAVATRPNSPKFHRDLGEMHRRLGHFREAEAALRASLNLNPNNPDALSLLGLTQAQQGNLAEGMTSCQTAIAMARSMPSAHVRLGYVLCKLKRKDEARASLEAARTIGPGFDAAQCLGVPQAELDAIFG
jgi:Flp pilus assembly protein TadD